jgi:hypothetical protein
MKKASMAVKTSASRDPVPSAISEVTPILNAYSEEIQQKHDDEYGDDTQLPFGQIAILCYCRIVEPVAFFSIFPFINKMIQETGIDEADVGFYSGWVVSISLD